MNIKAFLEKFTPTARRSEVDEIVDLIKTQLNTATDIWGRYAADLDAGKIKFTSSYARDFETNYRKAVRVGGKSWVSSIANNFVTAQEVVKTLQDHYLEKSVGAVARSMPLQSATVYRVLAMIGMAAEYADALLIVLTTLEAKSGNTVSPAEARYLERNRNSFFQVMALLESQGKNIDKIIKDLPDIDVDAETVDRVLSVNGHLRVDPLRSNLISMSTNPFYYVGMKWATWQAAKHSKAKSELRLLEYRLLQMQQQYQDNPDAKLEQAINYYMDEVKKLVAKISRLEE